VDAPPRHHETRAEARGESHPGPVFLRLFPGFRQALLRGALSLGRQIVDLLALRLTAISTLGGVFGPGTAVAAPTLAGIELCHRNSFRCGHSCFVTRLGAIEKRVRRSV